MDHNTSPVVITGGAQRLGLATAIALRQDGYDVLITYRRPRPLLEQLREQGIDTLQADFSSQDAILGFAETLRSRYESIRALIHNASEWVAEGDGLDDGDIISRMLNIHVHTPYLLNRQCGELLRRHGEQYGLADIVHMSDYVAASGSSKHIAYAASKAALDNLTLSFARQLAPLVKVNGIAPALLMFNSDDDEAYRRKASAKSLLDPAPGEAEGVNAIRYLMESRYLTGKTIALDGGRHLAQAC